MGGQPRVGFRLADRPELARALETIPVGLNPKGIAVGEGAVWVTNVDGGSVTRNESDTRQPKTFAVGAEPRDVVARGPRSCSFMV